MKGMYMHVLNFGQVSLLLTVEFEAENDPILAFDSRTNSPSIWRTKMAKVHLRFTNEFPVNMAANVSMIHG